MRAVRSSKAWITISALLAALPLGAGLGAQQLATRAELARVCLDTEASDAMWRSMELDRTALAYGALGDSVRAHWARLSAGVDAEVKRRMEALLDTQRVELRLLDTDEGFRTNEGPTSRFFEIEAGQGEEPVMIAEGDERAISLVPGSATEATVRAACSTAFLARAVADFGSRDARTKTRQVLAARARRWSNFSQHGYSLMPLELLVNGWCGICRESLEPPKRQIVLLHMLPTYAIRDSVGNKPSLTSEVVGLLFYNGARDKYWGVSAVTSFPTDGEPEVGAMVHVSRIGQLGVSFRDATFDRTNASLLLSTDLYRLIDEWRGRLKDERDAVATGLKRFGIPP